MNQIKKHYWLISTGLHLQCKDDTKALCRANFTVGTQHQYINSVVLKKVEDRTKYQFKDVLEDKEMLGSFFTVEHLVYLGQMTQEEFEGTDKKNTKEFITL